MKYIGDEELLIRLNDCLNGFMSINDSIRNNCCYIIHQFELNYINLFGKSCIIKYNIHQHIFQMCLKYPSELINAFEILLCMSKCKVHDFQTCQILVTDGSIDFMKSKLEEIYSASKLSITSNNINILLKSSLFLINLSSKMWVRHNENVIDVGIAIFTHTIIITKKPNMSQKIIKYILVWIKNIFINHKYMTQYLLQILSNNEGALVKKIFESLRSENDTLREGALDVIYKMVSNIHCILNSNHPHFQDSTQLLIQNDILIHMKHFIESLNVIPLHNKR